MKIRQMPMRLKNDYSIRFIANTIRKEINRGSAIQGKIETVLKMLKEITDLKHLRNLDVDHLRAVVDTLADRVENGELTTKTTATYISALNNITRYVNEYVAEKNLPIVSAEKFGLSVGHREYKNKANDDRIYIKFTDYLNSRDDIQSKALYHSVNLQRHLGLRMRESLAIKKTTIQEALRTGNLHLTKKDYTKNSRTRDVKIATQQQREVLKNALQFMRKNNLKSLVPTEKLIQQRRFAESLKAKFIREEKVKPFTFHGFRHAFAQERYNNLIQQGVDPEKAKLTVSNELGHNRTDITKVYLAGK